MHVALGVLLATLAQPWVGVGVYPANGVVTASGIDSWTSSGSTAWVGMPAPTVDCIAGASGGAMNCTGATATAVGSPTTVQSPWYPQGFQASPLNAASLNGSSQYYDLDNLVAPSTGFWMCSDFYFAGGAGVYALISKDDTATQRSWLAFVSGRMFYLFVFKTSGSLTYIVGGAITDNSWNTACISYDGSAGDGSGVMRANINGVVLAPVTNAVSPIINTSTHVLIGQSGSTYWFPGAITRLSYGLQPATDAQLATAVQSQISLLARKPANGAISFTSDGGFCWDSTLSRGWWLPSNVPCVTSAGMFVGGQSQNKVLQSQTIATGAAITAPWALLNSVSAAPTVAGNSATAPDGTTTATTVNFGSTNGVTQYSLISQSVTTTTASWVLSYWARTVSGTGTLYASLDDGTGALAATSCALTTIWHKCTTTRTTTVATNVNIGPSTIAGTGEPTSQPALSVYLWGVQVEPGYSPTLYHSTLGSPYSGVPTVANRAVTLTNPAQWCIGQKLTGNAWGVTNGPSFWALGAYSSANSALFFENPVGWLEIRTFDASAAQHDYYWQHGFTTQSAHTVVVCPVGANTKLYVDGVQKTLTDLGGAGTGILSAFPANIYDLGRTDGTSQFNASQQKLCQGNTYAAVNQCLSQP